MDDNDTEVRDAAEGEIYEFDETEEKDRLKSELVENNSNNQVVHVQTKSKRVVDSDGFNTHQCGFCEYVTTKRYLLARHMKCHSDERPFKCSVCERGFKTQSSLQNHVNTHTGNKPYHCKYCISAFTTSGELVRHIRYRHTHEKPHKCNECDYASVELSKLKRHIRCHTGERPYQCPHCTYASPDTFKLKRHMRIHTGEKPYECSICHAKFTQSNSLKAHKLIHSVGDKPVFQCELCPTTCGRKTDLRIHVQKLHTSEKPIGCKRCGMVFPDRYSYKIHSKTHDGEKCYTCQICPYASISQRHLEAHLLIHTDSKPFQCSCCEQSFRQKQLLKRHFNIYHNKNYIPPTPKPKTHVCPDCDKAFSHKGNLIRHMIVHDPDYRSKERAIQMALKMGRQNRVHILDNQAVELIKTVEESDENEDDIIERIDETMEDDNEEDQSGVTEIKKEDGTKNLVAVEGIDGQEYVVLEVMESEDEEDGTTVPKEEAIYLDDQDYMLTDFSNEVMTTIHNSVKIAKEEEDIENEMENCFGFEEDNEDILEEDDEEEKHHKSTIKLLDINE